MEEKHFTDKRICSICNSIVSNSWNKKGHRIWYRCENGYTCSKCYRRMRRNTVSYVKKYNDKKNLLHLTYKEKVVYVKNRLLTGKCSLCDKSIQNNEIRKTDMHHLKYDDNDPSAYTIELC